MAAPQKPQLAVEYTTQLSRDLKKIAKRGLDLGKLTEVLNQLAAQKSLAPRHRDHALAGNYRGTRECHIEPDWLLIYSVSHTDLILAAIRTGSHADLF
ncbi:MAG: type II toxin-antitoxin system YafQ family toxin [Bifidobacteriaceae bacterium]|jgi:mRNA interferase YafQ|nr:type II toxin-antitoxin system YafQ family toxin [Bifidobacteriaceae bacterium]